jgi:hypothetical protein
MGRFTFKQSCLLSSGFVVSEFFSEPEWSLGLIRDRRAEARRHVVRTIPMCAALTASGTFRRSSVRCKMCCSFLVLSTGPAVRLGVTKRLPFSLLNEKVKL